MPAHLRNNAAQEENRLWHGFPGEYSIRFNRQRLVGDHIAYFYCARAKLVIEPEDSHHYEEAVMWRSEIASGNRLVFIYKINGEFIGEGALVLEADDPEYTIPGRRVYISRMIVKKEYRNRGIGSAMLAFLIEKAKEMGFAEAAIGVDKDNANALHLYRKFGFTEVLFDGVDEHGEFYKLLKRI